MKRIKKLTKWGLSTVSVGMEKKQMPEPTKENIDKLVDKVAELTEMVNTLAERQGLIDPKSEQKDAWS